MSHGPGESLLTGSDLSKATAAAEAAVPGSSVIRAETDAAGTYEVHMKKSDGTYVTVELNSSFVETGIVSGFGAGPRGQGLGPMGSPIGHSPTGVQGSSYQIN